MSELLGPILTVLKSIKEDTHPVLHETILVPVLRHHLMVFLGRLKNIPASSRTGQGMKSSENDEAFSLGSTLSNVVAIVELDAIVKLVASSPELLHIILEVSERKFCSCWSM